MLKNRLALSEVIFLMSNHAKPCSRQNPRHFYCMIFLSYTINTYSNKSDNFPN